MNLLRGSPLSATGPTTSTEPANTVRSQARLFLQALFCRKPAELYVLLWTFPSKRSHWFRDVEEAIQFAESRYVCDLYVGVGLSKKDYGPNHRCVSAEIAGLVGPWADLDLKSEAHQKSLPTRFDEALTIVPTLLPPSIVVSSGNGGHLWWLLKEPWIFESDAERNEAATLIARFHTLLQYNSSQRGWAYDRLADLARVLRIPGTTNCKDPKNPKQVTIHSCDDRRYNPTDFKDYLDCLSIGDPESEERSAKAWADRLKDQPLLINHMQTIPEDTLSAWMKADQRFRQTWNRQRDDMHDQSQSGYDLALACFGEGVGLNDQQIVDLIVQHRQLHGRQRPNRLDYYRRTISKARNQSSSLNLSITIPSAGLGSGNTPPEETTLRTTTEEPNEKARLCNQISGALGVRILRFVKVTGKEPIYFLDLEQGRIAIPNVAKLISQRDMKEVLAGQVGRIIPDFKKDAWRQLAQMILDACITEQGTDELDLKGQARLHITDYLSQDQFIDTPEGQRHGSHRKPMIYEGKIAISASDLRAYINTTAMENHSVKSIASMIAALGAKSIRLRGNFKEQSRWALPVEEFDPKEYGRAASGEQRPC